MRPVLHRSKRVEQILPVVLIAVRLVPAQRLGLFGKHAESDVVSKRERAAGDLDLLIGVFSLPLAKRRDELFHLRLRFGFFRLGQQHARLDVHQMRRHRDKLAGNLHVHALALVEPGKILLQNRRDADVLNFYFIFAQQKQNDIQRTVKILQRLLRVYYILQVILGLFHALPSVLWNPQNMALGSV